MSEIIGSTSWGHTTSTQEGNVRTFSGNWTGTGFVTGTGDSEKILLSSQAYMESEIVNTGANSINLYQNRYTGGNTGVLKYRSGSTVVNCQAAEWETYSGSFASLGYAQIRMEAGSNQWWLTNGIATGDVVAAYQAKGAGSYVNSLHNLVEDVYNLVDTGHAPDWDDVNGWKFDVMSSEYLDTTIESSSTWSILCRYSNYISGWNGALFGLYDSSNGQGMFFIPNDNSVPVYHQYGMGTNPIVVIGDKSLGGVVGIAQYQGYFDGTADGDPTSGSWSSFEVTFLIGCLNSIGDSPAQFSSSYIQAIAIYNKTLTPTQIAAITDNMEAL
jgi:hypothetical protein